MRPLRLQSVAETEVAEALDWYRSRSPTAARGFLSELDRTLRRVQHDPGSFPLVTHTIRRALLAHFPYGVYYRVHPQVISVVGVIQGGVIPGGGGGGDRACNPLEAGGGRETDVPTGCVASHSTLP